MSRRQGAAIATAGRLQRWAKLLAGSSPHTYAALLRPSPKLGRGDVAAGAALRQLLEECLPKDVQQGPTMLVGRPPRALGQREEEL